MFPYLNVTKIFHSDSEDGSDEEGSDLEEDEDEDENEIEGVEDASDGSDDEDESNTAARPYMTLIKSLTEDNGPPNAKRRKLDHQTPPIEKPKDEPLQPEDEQPGDVDHVEEAEQAPDEADAEGAFDEDDEDEDNKADPSDPFESHFSVIDEASITRRLKAIEGSKWTIKKIAAKGVRTVLNAPETGDENDRVTVPAPVAGPAELSLKHRLQESVAGKKSSFDAVEQSLASYVFGYRDLHFCNRSMNNGKSVRQLACLHALNHVFKYVPILPLLFSSPTDRLLGPAIE